MARDLYDPLSDVTRKERRLLLAVSIVGIGIVKTGLLPEKISALGIEFGHADQKALLGIFTLIIAYFLAAFVVYAAADWMAVIFSTRQEFAAKRRKADAEDLYLVPNLQNAVLLIRAVFEFLLPIVVGIIAIVYLLTAKIPQSLPNK